MPALIPVCCVIIEAEGKVLIAQRPSGKHLAGAWEFPGGKIEALETPETALRREIEEELGCVLGTIRPLPPVEHDYGPTHIRLFPFVASLAPTSPSPRAIEHRAIKWLTRSEISTAKLAPADIPVLEYYLTTSV